MAVPISNVTRRVVYAPSGAGGVGPYAFTFEILANTDIAVFKDDVLLTLTTHYTVTINANGTGSVTITAAGLALSPVSPTQYAIVGNRTIARATDFTTGGDFFANTINDELDQQTIFAQQNAEGLQRALTAPQTDPTTIDMTLPKAADRANKTLAFDANGDPTLGISAADVANAVTYATNAANSATAAASSASSASSSASAASGSASTASTQASNASTSASNASTSASNASTSATNAAASASTATTQASNASTSATNAASSASAASTSASNAATSATNASNSATTASTQASNAATSASAASGSATSAASSAAAAASALDSFDDRYLGTKTSDPTLDNDGNALVAGALYFSTTQNVMKVYDGASWITATSAGATSLLRFRYVATSGQTTFSGADAASATLTYTVNNIAVHRNGVTLDTSEYTASNGTSIVLNVAAGTGDIVDIIAFKSFTVADALSAVSGGTVNGAVTITGAGSIQGLTVGRGAGAVATNTAVGTSALAANTTGARNTATGVNALVLNTTGNYNFAAGSYAMASNVSGNSNTGVGDYALNVNTASNNTGVGQFALGSNTSGASNSGVGSGVLNNNTTGSYNTALGASALNYNTTANNNTAVGYQAGYNNVTGAGNTFVGDSSGRDTTGGFNTFCGSSSGILLTSGTKNTIIGRFSGNSGGLDIRTASNYIVLSDGDGNPRMRMNGFGLFCLEVYSVTGASAANVYVDGNGNLYRSTSSLKYKTDVQDAEHGLADVMKLRSVTYKSKKESENTIKFGGLIAEEVHEAGLTEFVQYADDGTPDALAYGNMVSLCIKAIQELKADLDATKAELAALKGTA